MKLSKKTFLYSITISALLAGMILIYFVCMLPSLYVDYQNRANLDSAAALQKGYMEKRSYEGLNLKNPTGTITLEIPFEGQEIYLAGMGFKFTISTEDKAILTELDKLRKYLKEPEELMDMQDIDIDFDLLKDKLFPEKLVNAEYPLAFSMNVDEGARGFKNQRVRLHNLSGNLMIYEANAEDSNNKYTTYFAFGAAKDAAVISVLPVMTPQMTEIKAIVLNSIPMIVAVVFFLVLIASQYFSRKIVNPIIRLAGYAEEIQSVENGEAAPFHTEQKDEIGDLGASLNQLCQRLGNNYRELEKENKRQEVFLRASSHQLKTPVAAALLLTDGMIDGIGKYKDTKTYLPQVKDKLFEMRNIIDDILYLNRCTENLCVERVELEPLVQDILSGYVLQMEKKKLHFSIKTERAESCSCCTDKGFLRKILDNLISNAVAYTEENGQIELCLTASGLTILNSPAGIEEALLPHIREPFVSSNTRQKGKGLGLYISSYYAEILQLELKIENTANGVKTELSWERGKEKCM